MNRRHTLTHLRGLCASSEASQGLDKRVVNKFNMSSTPPLHYELRGTSSDPPVVFLHGFMGSSRDWDEVVEELSGTCYCMAIDLPGHGRSLDFTDRNTYTLTGAARGIVQVMKQADLLSATIIGYSMGGRLALYLAIQYGYLCTSLVIESATPGIRGNDERVRRKELDEKLAEELRQGQFEDFLRRWYGQPIFRSLAEVPEKLEEVLKQRIFNEPEELAKALCGMSVGAQAPLWQHLADLAMPVLLLAGEYDRKYVDIVGAMGELLPHAAVEIVPGTGHNVHVENPSGVAARIKRFLGGSLGFQKPGVQGF